MSHQASNISRRSFATGLVGGTMLTAASYRRVIGANERVGVGFIGFGLIGKRHVLDFKADPAVECVAVSEVHRGRLDEARAEIGNGARGYADFRRLIDDRQVQAVVVSTPDQWHALMTMLACAAGKDVYVEKPLTLFVREGRWMIDVAGRNRSVVQVGTQQRSGKHYQRARELIAAGHIGRVSTVRMQSTRNIAPGFGNPPDGEPPPELDWDMWLGPAPARPYNPNRSIYHFRWYWDYSGGQMTNLAAHSLDIVDWTMGLGGIRAVTSCGGRFQLTDNGETPDTQDALFEFGDWTASYSISECSRGEVPAFPLIFYGDRGSLGITRSGFRVTADPSDPPEAAIPQFTGAHPVGGPRIVRTAQRPRPKTEEIEDRTGNASEQFTGHARNFITCVKNRTQPVSDLESAHRVSIACHLANLSLKLGRKLRWNAEREEVEGDAQASAALVRPYRAPWDKVLSGLGVAT